GCSGGRLPATWPWRSETGSSVKPCPAMIAAASPVRKAASGNRPTRCLVAISQVEAALTKTSLAGSPIASRARAGRASSPDSHQTSAWVSSRRRTALLLPDLELAGRQRLEEAGLD